MTQSPSILIHWAKRERGLVTREGSDISHIEDVIGKRLVARQSGSGAQELLEKQLDVAGIAIDSVHYAGQSKQRPRPRYRFWKGGGGCFGLRCFADRYNLKFILICEEYFDLVIDRHAYFEEGCKSCLSLPKVTDL